MAMKTHMVSSTAALDSIMHFEKHFTSKFYGYEKKIKLFIPKKFTIEADKKRYHSNASQAVY